jgi:hypothetical protein
VGGGLVKRDLVWFEGNNNLALGPNTLSSSADATAPFEIAGADKVYHPADAVISTNNTIVVSAPGVTAPQNVRYAVERSSGAKTPLYNTNNLPASMFRTDTWTGLNGQTIVLNKNTKTSPLKVNTNNALLCDDKLPRSISTKAVTVYSINGKILYSSLDKSPGLSNVKTPKINWQVVIVKIR